MTTRPPFMHRLAFYYFDQDWDLEAPTPDGVLDNFAHDEGPDAVAALVAELVEVLAEDRPEPQLQQWWVHELRSQFEPRKLGMTYREWFAHVIEVLRATS